MIKILVLLLFSTLAYATEDSTKAFYKFLYTVEKNESLLEVYNKFLLPGKKLTPKNKAYKRTVSENPTITNWEELKPGVTFNFFIKIKDLDKQKFAAYGGQLEPKAKPKSNFRGSIFYMASYGRFKQETSETQITFYQNSPISLGTAWSFYPDSGPWSVATSFYASYLLASGNNLNKEDVKIPPELGGNIYAEYRFTNFTGYFGLDYERFSTFNIAALQKDQEFILDRNSVYYLTLGISKMIEIFKSPFFTKLSFSKSVITKTENNYSDEGNDSYDGYKAMWYLNKKISPNLFLHTLLKYHKMSGSSELETIRLGVGIGYIL